MKKKLAGLIVLAMILTCCLLPAHTVSADDGAASIVASATEVTVGDTFTVTLSITLNDNVPGYLLADYAIAFSNSGVIAAEGGNTTGSFLVHEDPESDIKSYSKTFSFTALKAGDAEIHANIMDPEGTGYGFQYAVPYEGREYAILPIPSVNIHVSDKPTEPPTDAPTEPITDAPTEPITDAPTEPVTDAPTQPPLSGNANLSSLAIAPASINEAFSPDRTSYTATDVDNSVTLMNVGATTEDPNATLVIKGNGYLVVGKNTITIEVTAPNGTKKEYTIEVNRKTRNGEVIVTPPTEAPTEKPTEKPTETGTSETDPTEEDPTKGTDPDETLPPVNGEDVEVSNIFDGSGPKLIKSDWLDEAMPAGFTRSTISYKGKDVNVAKSQKDMVLYCLASMDGETKAFYVYNPENDSFYPYYPVNPTGGVYVLLNIGASDITEGKRQVTLRVNEGGPTINAWSLSGNVDDGVFLVYAMAEDGSVGWYRFDTKIGTFVRYTKDAVPEQGNTNPEPSQPETKADPDSAAEIKKLKEDLESLQQKNKKDIDDYNKLVEKRNQQSILLYIVLVVLFIVLILAIILAWKLRSLYARYDFSDDGEGDDGDDDGGDDNGGDDNGGDDNGGNDDTDDEDDYVEVKPEPVIPAKQAEAFRNKMASVDAEKNAKNSGQTVDETIKQQVAAAYAARQAEKEAKAKEAAQKAAAAKEAAAKEVAEKEAKAKEAAQKAAEAKKAADAAAEKAKAAGMKLNAVSDKKGLYDLDVNSGEEKTEKASGNDEANDDDFEFIEF